MSKLIEFTPTKRRPCTFCVERLYEDEEGEICGKCRGDHYPQTQQDTFIRRAGFAIAQRKRGHPPMWILDGHLFDQKSALNIAQRRLGLIFIPRP